jgi:hypothetical protein
LGDTFETSTPEVLFPGSADFIGICLYIALGSTQLLLTETVILRLRHRWLKPKLGFTIRTFHMNVHSGLFAGEKVKPIGANSQDGGTHSGILALTSLSGV